ncbi:PorT family protein [Aurantibacter crassamenti]|uniref:porin family protein n=1 Tax=Aurantibacter crassamenti TaxID=1837375 RepID=UPI00193A29C4|nr:porin family protein [Aurantibacter crassamenti]MBM1105374.1 PorT family protein [Aurantibacter crassamenti]
MRKLSILVAFTFLTIVSVSAQDFAFGVKGGLNLASIGGNSYASLGGISSKVGFHIGGVVEIPISEKMAVQPELLYSSQGSKWSYYGSGNNLNLDYVNLPVLAKYYVIKGLSAEAGPLVGLLLSTNAAKEDFKSLDIAFGIGASYKIGDNLFAGLRYNKGIMNVNNDATYNGTNQNNVFQVFAGYAF